MKEFILDFEDMKRGFYKLEDTTKAPLGSALKMRNCQVTDRGGIAPREGTELLGTNNTSTSKCKGFYNFRKSFGSNEILLKAYDDELEVYSKNHSTADWFRIKDGYTADKEFGFITSLVNENNQDYIIGCNRYEPYFSWKGAITQLDGALVGTETDITVDTTLEADVLDSQTATGNTATTLTIATTSWAVDQWNGLVLYIPSTGKVRDITDTTANTITFDTLTTAPGNVAFEIRKRLFPKTGSVIYNGTEIEYTAIDVYNKLPVTLAHSADDNTGVSLVVTEYPENPRGNRFTNYLARIVVGNVRSALARGSGGALQGYSSAGSCFVSQIKDPFDFTYSAARVAGEGDIIGMPYGGGDITDIQNQENQFYVFKKKYIEAMQYSQDVNDIIVRDPLKAGIGSVGKSIKGADDIYFITSDKQLTSIGRAKAADLRPKTSNIGNKVKRFLDDAGTDDVGRGIEYKDKLYIPIKEKSSDTNNNVLLIYNKKTQAFDGLWDIGAYALEEFNDELYYADSTSPNVYKMFTSTADVSGDNRYPIFSEYQTHFVNLTPSKSNLQRMMSLYVEGYVRDGTSVTFNIFKDFSKSAFVTFDCDFNTALKDGYAISGFIGSVPFATSPMGGVESSGNFEGDDWSHFSFRVYFPFTLGNYFSVGHQSYGTDLKYEIIRYGFGILEDTSVKTSKIKSI